MNRKIVLERIALVLVLILATVFLSYNIFQVSELHSYDAYQQVGFSNMFFESGKISSNIQMPFSVETLPNPTGYLQVLPIIHLTIREITGLDSFLIAKIFTAFVFLLLLIFIFLFLNMIFKNYWISIFGILYFAFIPTVKYRLSYFVPENLAFLLFFAALLIVLKNETLSSYLLAVIMPFLLAVHPKSFILFLPLLIIFVLTQSKELLVKKNILIPILILLVGLPFFLILAKMIIYVVAHGGATYILYPPITVQPITFKFVVSLLGVLSLFFIPLGFISIVKNKDFRIPLVIWAGLTLLVLLFGSFLSFPSNRTILYVALLLPIFLGSFMKLFLVKFRKFRILIIFIMIILVILTIFNSTYIHPFLGWGAQEKEGILFLQNYLDGRENYFILTPQYSLPFGYGLKHIEFDEEKISEIFNNPTREDFIREIKSKYPDKKEVYIILESYSCGYIDRTMVKQFCSDDEAALFSNTRIKIIKLVL